MKHHSRVLIVGGLVRPIILQRIRRVLSDGAVQWIPTRESDPSSSSFASGYPSTTGNPSGGGRDNGPRK